MTGTISQLREAALQHAPDPDAWKTWETAAFDKLKEIDPDGYTTSAFWDMLDNPPWALKEPDVRAYSDMLLNQAALKSRIAAPEKLLEIPPSELFAEIMRGARNASHEKDSINRSNKVEVAVNTLANTYNIEMHGIKAVELHGLLAQAAESEYSNIRMAVDYVKFRGRRFVHKTQDADFNCAAWTAEGELKFWTPNAGTVILQEIEVLPDIPDFNPTARLAADSAKQLSGDAGTLRVTYDTEYRRRLNSMVIDPTGRYYVIPTGEIREIDPSTTYYEHPDTRIHLAAAGAGGRHVQDFERFLQERFGADNWRIVRDHLASVFLSGAMLDHKAKMLEIVGAPNTWKSFLVEYVASMLHESAVSSVSMKQMDSDSVFGPATVINRRLNYSEETAPELPRNQSTLKDIITREGGSARRMRSTQPIHAYRWPRWVIVANKMQPLGVNDDDMSMLIRMIIVETLPNPEGQEDWRTVLNAPGAKQSVMMYLLRRATEIYNAPGCMETQDADKTQDEYERLRKDDLTKFIENDFERLPIDDDQDVGVAFTWFWRKFQKDMKVNITRAELRNRLEMMDLEIAERNLCEPVFDRSLYTYQHGTNRDTCKQRTLILGLKSTLRGKL